jgi:hypothetical protein
METTQLFLSWWLVVTLSFVGAYDIYAIFFGYPNATVSYSINQLIVRIPSLAFFLGVLIGHVFFPLHIYHDDVGK